MADINNEVHGDLVELPLRAAPRTGSIARTSYALAATGTWLGSEKFERIITPFVQAQLGHLGRSLGIEFGDGYETEVVGLLSIAFGYVIFEVRMWRNHRVVSSEPGIAALLYRRLRRWAEGPVVSVSVPQSAHIRVYSPDGESPWRPDQWVGPQPPQGPARDHDDRRSTPAEP